MTTGDKSCTDIYDELVAYIVDTDFENNIHIAPPTYTLKTIHLYICRPELLLCLSGCMLLHATAYTQAAGFEQLLLLPSPTEGMAGVEDGAVVSTEALP